MLLLWNTLTDKKAVSVKQWHRFAKQSGLQLMGRSWHGDTAEDSRIESHIVIDSE